MKARGESGSVVAAAIWNPHRIHYDHLYTIEVAHHPAIIIAGPLLGDWLSQTAAEWIGEEDSLLSFHYSNRKASYEGNTVTTGGHIAEINKDTGEVRLSLFIRDKDGDIITSGGATVKLAS